MLRETICDILSEDALNYPVSKQKYISISQAYRFYITYNNHSILANLLVLKSPTDIVVFYVSNYMIYILV